MADPVCECPECGEVWRATGWSFGLWDVGDLNDDDELQAMGERIADALIDMATPDALTTPVHERRSTVAEIDRTLEGVLSRLVADPGRWVVILEVEDSDNRYVQFICCEDGSLVAEVVSNGFLVGAEQLSEAQEQAMAAIGWQRPVDWKPNWWRVTDRQPDEEAVDEVAEASVRVLHEVFGLDDEDAVVVTLFRSSQDQSRQRSQ